MLYWLLALEKHASIYNIFVYLRTPASCVLPQVLQRFEGVARMPLQPPAPLSTLMDMALELEIARGAWAVGAELDPSQCRNIAQSIGGKDPSPVAVLSILYTPSTPACTALCSETRLPHSHVFAKLHEATAANLTLTVTAGCDGVCHSRSRGHGPRSVSWLWSCSQQRVRCWGNMWGWR